MRTRLRTRPGGYLSDMASASAARVLHVMQSRQPRRRRRIPAILGAVASAKTGARRVVHSSLRRGRPVSTVRARVCLCVFVCARKCASGVSDCFALK